MIEVVLTVLVLLGVAFSFLGAIGIVRLPDVYMRMQAATKSGTLGVGFLTLAAAIRFEGLGVSTQAVLIVAFLFLTMPIAAHIIGRAAYASGVPMWEHTGINEYEEHKQQHPAETDQPPPQAKP